MRGIHPDESPPPNEPTEPRAGRAPRFRFDGRVAMVTGGAGAIGSAIAVGLAEHGADLSIADLREEPVAAIARQTGSLGRKSLAIRCDVRDAADVRDAVARTMDEFGRIDVLVHAAGYGVLKPLIEMPAADFEENLRVFLVSAFLVSAEVARAMVRRKSGGSIVHVSSIAGARALGRGTGAYAAAKAGLNALVRESAVEWAPYKIRVNAVAPCQVRTPSLERVLDSGMHGGRAAMTEKMLSRIPLGRFAEPEDMVGPAVFLASDEAAMVTGQVLFVDGGNTAQ